ncbi:putative GTP-binding protein 6 [Saccoglossus kowalevskii]|uniref:GTP-binding protein 6-like n=1 Tax=Saccoglossus kowalevskii TaxID=10224 RepID=A0ABM0GRN7_SACKO|nr:PREDICTED: putative GTP-binding protein 6-like [Saccoglossus kowalevskii]
MRKLPSLFRSILSHPNLSGVIVRCKYSLKLWDGKSVLPFTSAYAIRCLSCTKKVWSKSYQSTGFGSESKELDSNEELELIQGPQFEDEELQSHYERHHLSPVSGHKVFVIQPEVKWGPRKQHLTTGDLQRQEAVTLIETLENWSVVDSLTVSLKKPGHKHVFGKGNFAMLTNLIKSMSSVTAVFMSVEMLTGLQHKLLEEAWGVHVYDRYTIVLNIFKEHAVTKEAKLQIALAEIPYLRSRLRGMVSNMDQQSGAQQYIGGGGETLLEVQRRMLDEREMKIKKRLSKLKKRRELLRTIRKKKQFPTISVVGYTNSGKTTLIKSLTGDLDLCPQDKLFATLDITSHVGQLTNRMNVIYVDTVGFISALPHNLIDAFSATLEDVMLSDLIIHIRDVSHPDTVAQKDNVLRVLQEMGVPDELTNNMIEVCNKIDVLEKQTTNPHTRQTAGIMVSALNGTGLQLLKKEIEKSLLKVTDIVSKTLRIPMNGPQLSWLYKTTTVTNTNASEDSEHLHVNVIMTKSTYAKFKSKFGDLRVGM